MNRKYSDPAADNPYAAPETRPYEQPGVPAFEQPLPGIVWYLMVCAVECASTALATAFHPSSPWIFGVKLVPVVLLILSGLFSVVLAWRCVRSHTRLGSHLTSQATNVIIWVVMFVTIFSIMNQFSASHEYPIFLYCYAANAVLCLITVETRRLVQFRPLRNSPEITSGFDVGKKSQPET